MIFRLPSSYYERYNSYVGNGQSAMLQEVRAAIRKTYPSTDVGADGQVVVVPFTDGVTFEVLPAFLNTSDTYTFPDSNSGGRWGTTNPKPEIEAIDVRDRICNNNLKWLARMARAWKAEWTVPISGLLIDTFAYHFMDSCSWKDKSFLYYDLISRDFFQYLLGQDEKQTYWKSPGAGQYVWRTGAFEYKAKRCYNIAVEAIEHDQKGEGWARRQKWRDIYGTAFPAA